MRTEEIVHRNQNIESSCASYVAGSTSRKTSLSTIKGKERIALWATGILANKAIVYLFDYLLYPFVIWKCGIFKGGVIMAFVSFLVCWATLLFYDWSKKDWIGIETIKELKEYEGGKIMGRLFSWFIKKSDPVAILVLSIYFDPFVTTAYMRRGAHKYNGLEKRDWAIFIFSVLFGNFYWTLVAFTGVTLLEWVGRNAFGWFSF